MIGRLFIDNIKKNNFNFVVGSKNWNKILENDGIVMYNIKKNFYRVLLKR